MDASSDVPRETSGEMSSETTGEAAAEMSGGATAGISEAQEQAAVAAIGRFWWAWIVLGALWIIASFVILQFSEASATTVGIIIGIMLLVAGVQEFVVGAFAGG
ncbi:MAG TPA: hypothetical protein VH393_04205, partial [Ktedonobacterales bacterium]